MTRVLIESDYLVVGCAVFLNALDVVLQQVEQVVVFEILLALKGFNDLLEVVLVLDYNFSHQNQPACRLVFEDRVLRACVLFVYRILV